MRTPILTSSLVMIAASAMADPPDSSVTHCFDKIAQDIPIDQPITIVTNDSASVHGIMPIVLSSVSALHIWPATDSGYRTSVLIPFGNINRIIYTKPGLLRYGLVLAGMGLGVWGGAAAGVASAPESGWLEFSDISYEIVGGLLGGLIGAVCGSEIGKHFTTTVTLRCQ